MITNETRAKLLGYKCEDFGCEGKQWSRPLTEHTRMAPVLVPSYDTDANAVTELRAFVRARGKVERFQLELWNVVIGCAPLFEPSYAQEFDLLDATPAQQTAAFDAVFADELSRIE